MTARGASVAIVGGGLSGLMAAMLLEQHGVRDVVLFEARTLVGGRILSVDAGGAVADPTAAALDCFDLGPTWFWPAMQPQMDRLVDDLGLARFEQFEEGAMLFERSPNTPPLRLDGYGSAPPSMRIVGGTGALIAAIRKRLDPGSILTGHTVRRLRSDGARIELDVEAHGHEHAHTTWQVEHVLLALPPRLAERSIGFTPELPQELARRWRNTATWMAPHAKYVAIYDDPFWRNEGLSGSARSAIGPMTEIHDVTMPGGHAALFGFLGVPALVRRTVPAEQLRAHCRAQLRRLFGDLAAKPLADALKDWATDALTATEDDQEAASHHAEAPPNAALAGPWFGRMTGIGSE